MSEIIYPRSPRETMCGWMHLPRYIDKLRLSFAGKLHADYQPNLGKGFDQLWLELREGSPEPALMAEGRIVAAGALADQGDLKGALKLMERGAEVPKKVRDHHLRQWYVLGDLHDRSGDIIKARRFFGMIAAVDPQFADVADRLRGLGR